jgi:hypothetical protein
MLKSKVNLTILHLDYYIDIEYMIKSCYIVFFIDGILNSRLHYVRLEKTARQHDAIREALLQLGCLKMTSVIGPCGSVWLVLSLVRITLLSEPLADFFKAIRKMFSNILFM